MKNIIANRIIFLTILTLISAWLVLPYNVNAESISTSVQSEIDKYVLAKMEELRIKGASVSIVQGDSILYMKGYGISNNNGDAVTPETPFILGSTTKSITALAVMQLVEAGKVNLDEPVKKYIPEFHLDDNKSSSKITVRHLLNQTSGIPGTAGNSNYLDDTSTSEDFIKRLSTLTITSAPGKEYQYAEANYIILGVLISKVSGQSYEEYIEKSIYKPMDMKHSFTSKNEAVKNKLSTGYRTWFGFPFSSDFPYPKQYISASYLISSAEDMAHYLKIYTNNGIYNTTPIISSSGVAELFNPGPKLLHPEGYSYSMGWFVSGDYKIHDGRPTNYYSCIVVDAKNKTGVVLLTNTNNRLVTAEYSMPVAMGISNIISGKTVETTTWGFREIYLAFNLVLLALVITLLIRFILSLTTFRRKLGNRTINSFSKAVRYVITDLLLVTVFTAILLYLLVSMQISFSIAMLGQPDLVIAFITIIIISAVNLLIKLILIYVYLHRNAKRESAMLPSTLE